MNVTEFLTRRPQTKRELADRMGVKPRTVEEAIQAARLDGAPILSDADGYWLAASAEELEAQAARLRARYITQALTARAVRRTARRMREAEAARMRPTGTLWDALL